MDKWTAMVRAREAKAAVINRLGCVRLWTVREVCEIVGADLPKSGKLNPDYQFSMICCFDGAYIRDSLFVHYERDSVNVAKAAMNRGSAALLCAQQIEDYPCIIVPDVLTAL